MSIELIKKSNDKTSLWSGGATTELVIFPPSAVYNQRDFLWRISSATVEVEESNFTRLPNYNRILMVLDGQLHLTHKGQHSRLLNKFEQAYFDGGVETKSVGKVIDFNIIMSQDTEAVVEAIHFCPEEEKSDTLQKERIHNNRSHMFYAYEGDFQIEMQDHFYDLWQGDMAVITHEGECTIKAMGNNPSTMIYTKISYYEVVQA